MQPMNEPPPAIERSRRRPPRRRSDEPIPIPDAASRARRTTTVKLQQVLRAYQRAVLDVVEKRMAEVAEAASEATRRAVAEALSEASTGGPDRTDVARGVLAYVDERFQAMSLRLQQIDEALRRLVTDSSPSPAFPGPDSDVAGRLDAITEAVAALAASHREVVEELGRRTGQGVVAVSQVLREDLQDLRGDLTRLRQGMDGVEASVRSMHRTLAWEGMRTPRPPEDDAPST
jgi:hypothetical protein